MHIPATSTTDYISKLDADRARVVSRLFEVIRANIPSDFEEAMSYGMPGFVVPHSIYPGGYHCKPSEPLPFISIASQKGFVAIYHMGIYSSPELLSWWENEYPKHAKRKLDMGKSCIRFKKMDDVPYELIAELASKMTAEEWILRYEANLKK
ncbi:MAG: hypothetical protein RL754_351 [Bacteroidota bacterium]|jgi:uncharacterized protein YdhG (YjbR/CyaY superfamily)